MIVQHHTNGYILLEFKNDNWNLIQIKKYQDLFFMKDGELGGGGGF